MGSELTWAAVALHCAICGWFLKRLAVARPSGDGAACRVSVIIPARNEAVRLPRLLESIPKDGPLEIIVVDDESEDGTAEVAMAHGARVVACGTPPAGWIGKTWACWRGAGEAAGDTLLFLDADCWFEAGGYDSLLGNHRGGALSVLPWHAVCRPVEQLSAFFNLVMAVSSLDRGLFGQCLLVGKKEYFDAGGHEAVKGCILENVVFGKVLREAGIGTRSMVGKGILGMRMYPDGFASLVSGWSKGFAQGAALVTRGRMLVISAFLGGFFLPVAGLAVSPWWWGIHLLYAALLWMLLRRIGSYAVWAALLFPLPMIFYHIVFLRALAGAGKRTAWKGRAVHVG